MNTATALKLPERRAAWEIAQDIARCFDPETGEVDAAAVDSLTTELGDKAEAINHVLNEYAAHAAACKAEAARLTERARVLGNRGAKLETYLLGCMRAAGTRKLETATLPVSIRAGSERVEVTDANAVPVEYLREKITVEHDKIAIKAAIKSGKTVPGAALVRGEETLKFG